MVHIARGMLDRAESTLREGTIVQDRQAHLKQRYPAKGLHWLLGLVRLARGDAAEALLEFDREIASGAGQLYAPEFAMNAHDGAGFAHLATGDAGPRRWRDSAGRSSCFRTTRARWSAWAPRSAPTARRPPPTRRSRGPRRRSNRFAAAGGAAKRRWSRRFTTPSRDRHDDAVLALHRLLDKAESVVRRLDDPGRAAARSAERDAAFAGVLSKLAERAR